MLLTTLPHPTEQETSNPQGNFQLGLKHKHVAEGPKAHFHVEGQFCCDSSCITKPRSIWCPMKLLLAPQDWQPQPAAICSGTWFKSLIGNEMGWCHFLALRSIGHEMRFAAYSTNQKKVSLSRCCWHDLEEWRNRICQDYTLWFFACDRYR